MTEQDIVQTLLQTREVVTNLGEQIQGLVKQLERARGTGDHTEAAAEASAPVTPPMDARAKIAAALTRESLSAEQIVRATGETAGKVVDELRALRQENRIYNVGSAEHPVWTWKIGDATTTHQLHQMVQRLITERPLTTREIADATGARLSRVGGVLVAIQRGPDKVLNLGTQSAARWFVVSSGARDANLSPKGPVRRRRVTH